MRKPLPAALKDLGRAVMAWGWACVGGAAVKGPRPFRLDLASLKRHARLCAAAAGLLYAALSWWLGNSIRLVNAYGPVATFVPPILLAVGATLLVRKRGAPLETPSWGAWPPKAAAAPLSQAALASLGAMFLGFLAAGLLLDLAGRVSLALAQGYAERRGFSFEMPPARPRLSDAENAAHWLLRATESPSLGQSAKPADLPRGEGEDAFVERFLRRAAVGAPAREDFAAAKRLLARHREAVELALEAAARGSSDWGMDWSLRPTLKVPLPRYGRTTFIGRLLACRAVVKAREGRAREAVDGVAAALALSERVAEGEPLISQMISLSMAGSALDAAAFVLRSAPLALAESRWRRHLDDRARLELFRRTVSFEHFARVKTFAELSWPQALSAEYSEGAPISLALYWPVLKLDMASYFRALADLDSIQDLPYPRMREARDRAAAAFERKAWLLAQLVGSTNLLALYERAFAVAAKMRMAALALEVRRHKARRGAWPKDLAGDPARSQDPFSEGSLTLERAGRTMSLCSVGPERPDEGPARPGGAAGDLCWGL